MKDEGGEIRVVPSSLSPMLWAIARVLTNFVFWGLGRARCVGLERLPRSGPLIVAVNHVSWVDPVLAANVVEKVRDPFFLGKEELFRGAFSRWVLTGLHSIRLDRSRGDVGALRKAEDLLRGDGCLILFPEGTRSRTGSPGRPKPGIGFLAYRTGAVVVPARVFGTRGWKGLGRLAVRFGAPMSFVAADGAAGKAAYQRFADRVMAEIFKLEMG